MRAVLGDRFIAMPRQDGAGIVVVPLSDGLNAGDASAAAGVPVSVIGADSLVLTTGTRQNDGDPWWGGSAMIRPIDPTTSVYCSTAFSVLDGAYGRLLSAAHCDLSGDLAWTDGTRVDMFSLGGSTVWAVPASDSLLLDPVGGTQGKVHVGGIASSTYKKVAGSATNSVGDPVCTGGANSGEHCGDLTIISDAAVGSCNGYTCTMIVASSSSVSVVAGDSGGPVYSLNADGRVTAKGVISAGLTSTRSTCPVTQVSPNGDCFKAVAYLPIRPLLSTWNVSLETML